MWTWSWGMEGVCPDFKIWAELRQQPRGLYQGCAGLLPRDQPRMAACLQASVGIPGHASPISQLRRLLGARAVPRLSSGTPADTVGMRKHASNRVSKRSLPRGCSHVWETRREVSGLKQRINILNLFLSLCVRLSMCARTGACQREKERLCAYMHTPHLCLRHSPIFFSSRQVFHELQ